MRVDREGLLGGNCRQQAKADLNSNKWVEVTLGDREEGRSCGQIWSNVAGCGVLDIN